MNTIHKWVFADAPERNMLEKFANFYRKCLEVSNSIIEKNTDLPLKNISLLCSPDVIGMLEALKTYVQADNNNLGIVGKLGRFVVHKDCIINGESYAFVRVDGINEKIEVIGLEDWRKSIETKVKLSTYDSNKAIAQKMCDVLNEAVAVDPNSMKMWACQL